MAVTAFTNQPGVISMTDSEQVTPPVAGETLATALSNATGPAKTQKSVSASTIVARTKISHVLEMHRFGQPVRAIALPNQPSRVSITKTPAVSIRRTIGQYPIRQHSSDRMWSILITGMTGIATRPYNRASGDSTNMPGLQTLFEFDAFLASYQEAAEQDSSIYLQDAQKGQSFFQTFYDRTWLVYRDFSTGQSYRVEVAQFDFDRSERTRVANADWSLRLTAYQVEGAVQNQHRYKSLFDYHTARRTSSEKFQALLNASAFDLEKTQRFRSQVEGLTKAVLESKEYQDRISGKSADNWWNRAANGQLIPPAMKEKMQAMRKPFLQFQGYVRQAQSIVAQGTDVLMFPATLAADIIRSGQQVIRLFDQMKEAGWTLQATGQQLNNQLQDLYSRVSDTTSIMTVLFGSRRLRPEMLQSDVPPYVPGSNPVPVDDKPATPVTIHIVAQNESWPDITKKYFGNPESWMTVAQFNGAKDAYTGGDGQPLQPGMAVFVPGLGSTTQPFGNVLSPDDLYGTGPLFDFVTGDFVIADQPLVYHDTNTNQPAFGDPGPQRTGLARATGEANFKQSLVHRMLTVRGELPGSPTFGLIPIAPGEALYASSLVTMVSDIAEQLRQDPRTKDVSQVEVQQRADGLTVQLSVTGVASGQVTVVAPLK